jgi:hypothetical protein
MGYFYLFKSMAMLNWLWTLEIVDFYFGNLNVLCGTHCVKSRILEGFLAMETESSTRMFLFLNLTLSLFQ